MLKIPFQTVSVPDRPYNDKRYFINMEKIEKEVDWRCNVKFADGLSKTVAWYLAPRDGTLTEHLLVYGSKGWIGAQFVHYLKCCGVSFMLADSRPGEDSDEVVESEILEVAPTHLISFIGRTKGPGYNSIEYLEGGSEKLKENIADNLYAPCILASICDRYQIHMTYIGTGCIFQYDDDHPIEGPGYKENDTGNYMGNNYSVVKSFTDRIMQSSFSKVLNVRIRLPVNYQPENRNLVAKVASFNKIFDIPDSITILPDMIPIVLDLMRKGYTGTLNLTNPGPIRHSETLSIYKKLVDAEKEWNIVDNTSPEGNKMRNQRAHCTLDTSLLEELYPHVRCAEEGVYQAVVEVGRKLGKLKEDLVERIPPKDTSGPDHGWA